MEMRAANIIIDSSSFEDYKRRMKRQKLAFWLIILGGILLNVII
jgi:hypothetical protein